MDKKTSWWKAHRPSKRRLIQLYCALLYNANLKGFQTGRIYTGNTKAACVPGLNCYSCPGAVGACPLGSLQNALASSGNRAGTYVLGILLLYGILLGRTICGWLCPLGMIQELLHKIPTPKIRKSRVTRVLSWLKYVVLVIFVISIPLWYGLKHNLPVPSFCKYICPAGTLEAAMGLLSNSGNSSFFSMLGILFTRKFIILLAIATACIFCYRSFCRFLCPLGAIYSLFNKIAVVGVRVDDDKCIHCGGCVRHCQMDVRHVGDHECINCSGCMGVCPTGAISLKAGKVTLKAPEVSAKQKEENPELAVQERKRRLAGCIARTLAIVVLGGALWYCNLYLPRQTTAESDAAFGCRVGELLPDFTIETLDGSLFHLADTRGNVTFLNLWATYCTPCVRELPYFSRLQDEHPEISILAVHASYVDQDLNAYLEAQDWHLKIGVDDEDDSFYTLVDNSGALPQTIVLNARGEVIYNQAGSVTFEKLEALLEQAEAGAPVPGL